VNNRASSSDEGMIHCMFDDELVSETSEPSVRENQGKSERSSKVGGDDVRTRYSMTLCVALMSNDSSLILGRESHNKSCNE